MRRRQHVLLFLGLLGMAVLALALSGDAIARVGGGQHFSSGGGGSYGGGSSSGGGGLDILFLLIRLVIAYPAVGVPLLIVFIVVVAIRGLYSGGHKRKSWSGGSSHSPDALPSPAPPPPRRLSGLVALHQADPAFSLPVLVDFLQLVHRRATEAAVNRRPTAALAPFVSPEVLTALKRNHAGVTQVSEVVYGSLEVAAIELGTRWTRVVVRIKDNRLEAPSGGAPRRIYLEEEWVFQRAAGAISLSPEDTLRLGCPSCGAAVDTDDLGACTHCGNPITRGQLQWQAMSMRLTTARRPAPAPKLGRSDAGDEPSVRHPTRRAPDLNAGLRGLVGRHPDFSIPGFNARVEAVYTEIQAAWSDGDWGRARPFVTDPLYQTLRFWLEGYRASGLHNRLGDVRLERVEIVKVQVDAWYEAVTVRIWGSMRDWVEDASGKVVGGNDRKPRRFSEYWTFLRASGTGGAASADTQHCPSCGAPLDQVSAAGVCGYCDTKIASGRFDWVLSRIEQTEVYRG